MPKSPETSSAANPSPRELASAFHDWHKLVKYPETCESCATEAAFPRHCLNVRGSDLCDGPQGHDGGCVFGPAWELVRQLEDHLAWLTRYAGDTTNELREARDAVEKIYKLTRESHRQSPEQRLHLIECLADEASRG